MNGSHLKKLGIFAGGVLFGTAGLKVLGSKEAKKLYVNCLAAGLRARDCAMKTAESLQADAEDILAEAEEINRARLTFRNTVFALKPAKAEPLLPPLDE